MVVRVEYIFIWKGLHLLFHYDCTDSIPRIRGGEPFPNGRPHVFSFNHIRLHLVELSHIAALIYL